MDTTTRHLLPNLSPNLPRIDTASAAGQSTPPSAGSAPPSPSELSIVDSQVSTRVNSSQQTLLLELPGLFGEANRVASAVDVGLQRAAFGLPKELGASRWFQAFTSATVGSVSNLVAALPVLFARPQLGLPALALTTTLSSLAPALASLRGSRAPQAQEGPDGGGWLRNLRRPEVLLLALRLLGNTRHGLLMEPAAVGAHIGAQWALQTWPQAEGSWVGQAAQQAAWVVPEAARVGAMLVAEQAYRQLQLHYVDGKNKIDAAQPADTAACNTLMAHCDQLLRFTAVPGTHLSFSGEQNFFWNNQVVSVERQFADGIRLFLIEYFVEGDTLFNSHSTRMKFGTMQDAFARLSGLLAAHPKELIVIKLSNQQYAAPDSEKVRAQKMLWEAFNAGGLTPYFANFAEAQDFSLGNLVSVNARAILAYDDVDQSNFATVWPGQIKASNVRSASGATPASLLNAFTTYIWPVTSAATNRQLPKIWREAIATMAPLGAVPNLVAVNDYQTSEVVSLARAQNRAVAIQVASQKADVA